MDEFIIGFIKRILLGIGKFSFLIKELKKCWIPSNILIIIDQWESDSIIIP